MLVDGLRGRARQSRLVDLRVEGGEAQAGVRAEPVEPLADAEASPRSPARAPWQRPGGWRRGSSRRRARAPRRRAGRRRTAARCPPRPGPRPRRGARAALAQGARDLLREGLRRAEHGLVHDQCCHLSTVLPTRASGDGRRSRAVPGPPDPAGRVGPLTYGEAMRYAVFLRGVNVGGRTIPMAELREVLGRLAGERGAHAPGLGERRLPVRPGRRRAAFRCRDGAAGVLRLRQAWVVVLEAERLRTPRRGLPVPGGRRRAAHLPDAHLGRGRAGRPGRRDARGGPGDPAATARPGGDGVDGRRAARPSTPARSSLATKARFAPAVTDRNLRTVLKVMAALEALDAG